MVKAKRSGNIIQIVPPQETDNYHSWDITARNYPTNGNMREQFQFLTECAVNSPSSHNTQPWAFYIDENDNSIWVLPNLEKCLAISDPTTRELYLSVGCALATLRVAALAFGWRPTVSFVKDSQNKAVNAKVQLQPNYKPTPYDIKLFEAITKRANYDGDHLSEALDEQVVKLLERNFDNQDGIEFELVEDQVRKNKIAKLVQVGDTQIFSDRGFTGELIAHLRDTASLEKDGLPTHVLGLPAEIRPYVPRMILSATEKNIEELARNDKKKIEASTAIGVIACKDDNPQSWMLVGELYQLASLVAANKGVYFGARGVLIETGNLHKDLEEIAGISGRAQMMFRIGYPSDEEIWHTPRYPGSEKITTKLNEKLKAVSTQKPTIFQLSKDYDLKDLRKDLGKGAQILRRAYSEHWLRELFDIRNPGLKKGTPSYFEKQRKFVESLANNYEGVWIYNPFERTLEHLPDEDEFYEIITANNAGEISKETQKRIRELEVGVCGLSGSGTEALLAVAMSGAKYLRLADFDYISPRNKNRMEGRVGENKTLEIAKRLWSHNPFLELTLYPEGLTDANRESFAKGLALIVEQTDSTNKFKIRKVGKELGANVVQVTDFPDPIIDIETPGDQDFGGRAKTAGITEERMDAITSIGESTAYLLVLMDPDKVSTKTVEDFTQIAKGRRNGYTQIFIGSQSGGGALGRVFLALAEDRLHELPRSYVVQTVPPDPGSEEAQKEARIGFNNTYKRIYGTGLNQHYTPDDQKGRKKGVDPA